MRKSFFHVLCWVGLIFLIGVIFGCAAAPPKPSEPIPPKGPTVGIDPYSQLLESNRRKAMEYEKQGELKKALGRWQIVASFIPDDGRWRKG